MNLSLKMLIVFFVFAQLGCAMSKKACTKKNWNKQGYSDGILGKPSTDILDAQKVCAEKDVQIPLTDYKEGWVRGVEKYCSTENAYKLGVAGNKTKVKNCPVEFQPAFNESYKKGEAFTQKQKKIAELEKRAAKQAKDYSKEIKELKKAD